MKGEGQVWTSDRLGLTPAGSMALNQDHVLGEEENRQLAPGITDGASAHLSGSRRLLLPGKGSTTQDGAGGSKPHEGTGRQGMGTQLSQHINILSVIPGLFLLWGSEYSIKLSISN